MASKVVCAVYDTAAQCFGQPGVYASAGVASRMFTDEVNRIAEDNLLNRHPQDFSLYQIAIYDDTAGIYENSKVKLVDALSVIVRSE